MGSNPVINSGHSAYADEPARVSGQHDHPSHVPLQYLPKKNRETNIKYSTYYRMYIFSTRASHIYHH